MTGHRWTKANLLDETGLLHPETLGFLEDSFPFGFAQRTCCRVSKDPLWRTETGSPRRPIDLACVQMTGGAT